jgi:hypothetical protein
VEQVSIESTSGILVPPNGCHEFAADHYLRWINSNLKWINSNRTTWNGLTQTAYSELEKQLQYRSNKMKKENRKLSRPLKKDNME